MTSSEEPGRLPRRILTHDPKGEPLWVRLYEQAIGAAWQRARAARDHQRRGLVKVLAQEAGLRAEDFK